MDDQPVENPTADPVASDNLSIDSLSSEGPPVKTTITEEIKIQAEEEKKRASALAGTSADETKPHAQSPPLHAQEVAERVLSAPVVDPSEEIASPPLTTPAPAATSSSIQPKEPANQKAAGLPAETTETAVSGPGSSVPKTEKSEGGKVSAWLKNKLRRPRNKSSAEQDKGSSPSSSGGKGGLIATISAPIPAPAPESSAGSSGDPSSSVREVAMAGGGPSTAPWNDAGLATATSSAPPLLPEDTATGRSRSPPSSVSSLSEDDEDDEQPRGRSQLKREETVSSGGGEEELFEEARDHFEPERLAPPGPLKDTATAGASGSPVRDSKFSEDL